MSRPLIEVCLDSAESALAAQQGGADRVELCDNLVEGGTTPSAGMIEVTRASVGLGLQVMIRPRGGDFLYSETEVEIMRKDIAAAAERGADGVVFGLLLADGAVDRERTAQLAEAARPMNVTFHRAFDMSRDPLAALDTLIELGIDRILTSGRRASVCDGLELIRELHARAAGRIVIMPGCGITAGNAREVVARTGVGEIHVVGNREVDSSMAYRNPDVFMGRDEEAAEYRRTVTAAEAIREIVEAAGS